MLDPQLRIEGFTHADWLRLLELGSPPASSQDVARRAGSRPWAHDGLIAVRRNDQVVKLVHTRDGRRAIRSQDHAAAVRAAALADQHGTGWALRIDVGALDRIVAAVGQHGRQGDGIAEQFMTMIRASQAELARGSVDLGWSSPDRHRFGNRALRIIRTPVAGAALPQAGPILGWLADLLCPPGRSVLLATFSGTELWTSVIVGRGRGGIQTLLGPEPVRDRLRPLSSDVRANHQAIRRAVQPLVGEGVPFLACSARHGALRSVLGSSSGGAWSRAISRGDVVIEPRPAALSVPLFLDAAMARLVSFAGAVQQ